MNNPQTESTDFPEEATWVPNLDSNGHLVVVIPESERYLNHRLGYRIEIRDHTGSWLKYLKLPDDNGTVTTMSTSLFFTGNPDIDEIISAMLYRMVSIYMPETIVGYSYGVHLFTSEIIQGKSVDDALLSAVNSIKQGNELVALKHLVRYFLVYAFAELSPEVADDVISLSMVGKNKYVNLFTLDAELGPFTREELKIFQDALRNEVIHIENRVVLALCMTLGLRPIQISLLKQSDFVRRDDMGVCYLNVPRVKQKDQKRRTSFTKRNLHPKITELIEELILSHQSNYGHLGMIDPPLIMRRIDYHTATNPHGELYEDDKKDFEYHVGTYSINFRLNQIGKDLPLSPRTGQPFNLFVYRFRYTLGSQAVVEGMTEAEVADLLDHSHLGSVKHYFRYTREMFEILEEATNKRVEQKYFTAAWLREGDQTGNIYGKKIIETHAFTTIGKCQKGAACSLEPAVACYSCEKFCPGKDPEAHKNALETIKDRKTEAEATTTGSLINQLDEALAGCLAAIEYSQGKPVTLIQSPIEQNTANQLEGPKL